MLEGQNLHEILVHEQMLPIAAASASLSAYALTNGLIRRAQTCVADRSPRNSGAYKFFSRRTLRSGFVKRPKYFFRIGRVEFDKATI